MKLKEVFNRESLIFLAVLFFVVLVSSCKKGKEDDNIDDSIDELVHILLDQLPEHMVLYEVNLRAYSSSGDFAGITSRIDQIASLGVNVIWLMPIFPVGQVNSVNSPYCVQNYTQVNSEFGTLSDLLELVDSAHNRNMAVILDWVANHTSWDNPWITNESWYTQVDGEIISPAGTNWADVADLDYDNTQMRQAMINAMTYWIQEANIDGFRFDAADFVPFDFWQEALSELGSSTDRDLIFLAEGSRADHFTAGCQMNFSWDYYNQMKNVFDGGSATQLYTTHTAEYQNVPEGKYKLRFTTNHDESAWDATPVVLFNGKDGALTASLITIYMGGVPLIYGSQEVGILENIPFFTNYVINWSLNPDMLQTYTEIIQYYLSSEALLEGAISDFSTNDVVCFSKIKDSQEVLVIANVRNTITDYEIPAEFRNTSWIDAFSSQSVDIGTSVSLEGYSYMVLTGDAI